jgi:hypothetical protein
MSFNVFDESPENELVLKEQQSQNKVRRRRTKTNDRFLWITFYDCFGRDWIFMAFGGLDLDLMAFLFIPYEKSIYYVRVAE